MIWLLPVHAMAQSSLCSPVETTEWSCETKAESYALCSSKDLGPASGYLQYRAGRTKVRFVYPQDHEQPRGHFRLRLLPRGVAMGFSDGGYRYDIHEPLAGPTTIEVDDGKSPHVSIVCRSAGDTLTLTSTMERFRLLGVYE